MARKQEPKMRCPVCRMWITVTATTKTLPPHTDPLAAKCAGAGKPPAAKRGPFK